MDAGYYAHNDGDIHSAAFDVQFNLKIEQNR